MANINVLEEKRISNELDEMIFHFMVNLPYRNVLRNGAVHKESFKEVFEIFNKWHLHGADFGYIECEDGHEMIPCRFFVKNYKGEYHSYRCTLSQFKDLIIQRVVLKDDEVHVYEKDFMLHLREVA